MSIEDGVVIVGGSIAGHNVARTLRKEGYEESITMIDAKNTLPYDRSELSTEWMLDREKMKPPLFQEEKFFEDSEIAIRLDTKITEIIPEDKVVLTDKKEKIPYNTLVLATGSSLRELDAPGEEANGIFYLRDYENAVAIKEWSKDVENVAIIGAGFIGLEMAATFARLDLDVTVIEFSDYPLGQILGEEASKYFVQMHEEHGVEFITGAGADSFKQDVDGNVTAVITTEGQEVACGMAIIGVGVTPNLSIQHLDILLLNKNATVTVAHVYSKNTEEMARQADILITATGVPGLVTKEYVKDEAIVIDVGISRVDGKILGDVAYDEVAEGTSHITPVPGGVGAVTTTMLARNVVKATTLLMSK